MCIKMYKIVFGLFFYYYLVPLECDILVPTVMSNKFDDDMFGKGLLMLKLAHEYTDDYPIIKI